MVSYAKVKPTHPLVIPSVLQPQRTHRGVHPHAGSVPVTAAWLPSAPRWVTHDSGSAVNVTPIVGKERAFKGTEEGKVQLRAAHHCAERRRGGVVVTDVSQQQ